MLEERRNWNKEETIVAFNIYCKIAFSKATKTNPVIISNAMLLGRTPSALSMKIGNLASLDPELKERGIGGLPNISKLDKEVWDEFNGDWDMLAFESEKILAKLKNSRVEDMVEDSILTVDKPLPKGLDRQSVVKARVNQSFFRSAILSAYDNKCCITGISVPELLVASHIIPWAKRDDTRTDPRNGLLLNSIHDRAFDAGLITITSDYVVKLSDYIYGSMPHDVIDSWFVNYDGKTISLPDKFLPSKDYLKWHNDNIFKGSLK